MRDILAKFLIAEMGPREDRLHIFSAHCVEGDKGRIYVEARKESHVRTALASIPFVRTMYKLLKRTEMPRVVVAPQKAELQEGQWVRIRNGIYRDDLAQVWARSEHSSDHAFVRIVPRISKEQYSNTPNSGKRGRAQRSSMRPPPAPFRPELVEDKSTIIVNGEGSRVSTGGDSENAEIADELTWSGMNFKSGLLVKEFRISGLHTSNVTPTQEEIGRFKRAVSSFQKSLQSRSGTAALAENELDNFDAVAEANRTKGGASKVNFAKGDHVQVTRGEYVSVTGIVVSSTGINLDLRPDHPEAVLGKRLITVPTNLVRKYFAPGVHVKILGGVYTGETGVITAVNGDEATIYSDVVHKEIRANMSELQIAFSTGSGNTALGSYHLFDLVQIGESVGVIVDVEREGFQILGENGQSKYVPLAEVGQRRNVSRASISDAHGHNVNLGETVRILEGSYKDVTGLLKHVSRTTVFIQCANATVRENRGLVCLRKQHIASVVDRSTAPAVGGPQGHNGNNNGAMGPPGGAGRGQPNINARRIDPSLNRKEVTVIRGQWKGYRGIIKTASDREYTILLSTGSRTVKVPKGDVKAADAVANGASSGGNNNRSGAGGWGSQGSSHFDGSQTPMRMQTPHHVSAGGTDSFNYDAYAGDEFDPNYRPATAPSASSNDYSGGSEMDISSGPSSGFSVPQTPGAGFASGGFNAVPFTPGGMVSTPGGFVPQTPGGMPMVPMTPGAVPQTPGAGFAVPQTPGVISSYGMPPPTPGAPMHAASSGFAVPQTPGGFAVPSTPGGYGAPPMTPGGFAVPSTPGGLSAPPMTPGALPPTTPGGPSSILSAPSSMSSAAAAAPVASAANDWCRAGFEVYDTTGGQTPPPRYIILDPMLGSPLVKVEGLSPEGTRTGVISNITRTSLKLVPLTKKDTVYIFSTGKLAQLIGVDDQEQIGVAKNLETNEIQVLSLSEFAKMHEL